MTYLFMLLDLPAVLVPAGGAVLFIVFIFGLLYSFLKKASPGTALVKTGLGLTTPQISTSSSIVIPLIHRAETIDLTVKIVKIVRRSADSLSCADGIRAEVEVDFYVKINSVDEDIRRVATTIGCDRASNLETIKQLFEAKFADALKTAGSKLTFDQLYQNRHQFRDEILIALGHNQGGDVVLNGYRLDDVAIHYLEQLPLNKHDENNVLDAKGIKEIAQRTSVEAESANQRLREREVTIAEQNRQAKVKQLQIEQDLKEKEAIQQREIKERQLRESAQAEKTFQEQEQIKQQAAIEKERLTLVSDERKQQEIKVVETERERAILVAQEEKNKAAEIAKIQRESATAEQLKEKLAMLEETAKQEALKIKAEEEAMTVRAVEVANREKQIQIINAEREAAVQVARKNVEADAEAYKLLTIGKARMEAAELELQAAEKQAKALLEMGNAEAAALAAKLTAENSIGRNAMMAQALEQLVPMLPQIIEKMMLPAEKIDSIKFLNINGLNGMTSTNGTESAPLNAGATGGVGSIIGTLMNVSMLMPVMKEVIKTLRTDSELSETLEGIKQLPGGEKLLNYFDTVNANGQ
ncbi:MAG: hypothetical protein MUC97_09735 [Bernardetiaceae bacterium]|jgi:uncharacterized membrane protein YqiK|nr:hypothetical protein [Bernardetiaceae bacterium]